MNKKTKHPNVAKCRELGMLFLNLHESDPACRVEMGETRFSLCGTAACHAGWFQVSKGRSWGFLNNIGYEEGSRDIARFLGFYGKHPEGKLESWAEDNPDLWGNKDGDGMFCSSDAFYSTPPTLTKPHNMSIKHIGLHWLKVADRIEALAKGPGGNNA